MIEARTRTTKAKAFFAITQEAAKNKALKATNPQ